MSSATVTKDVEPGALPAPRARLPADDFAIVIGIDDYPAFRSLRGAVADATAFRNWLLDPAGGGLAADRVKLVTSTPAPTPEQKHIDQVLEELIEAADRNGGGRRLYFYFSGHGMTATDAIANVSLLLANWSKKRARLGLSSQSYTNDLAAYGLFEEIAVFLDCCRTESTAVVGLNCTLTPVVSAPKSATRNFVAYATEAGRSAFERPELELWQGVFTRCLLRILKRTPIGVLATELKNLLEREVKEAQVGQQAHVDNALFGESRFGPSESLARLEIGLSRREGLVRLFNHSNILVGEHEATGAWSLLAEAGFYKLVDATGATLLFEHPAEKPVAF